MEDLVRERGQIGVGKDGRLSEGKMEDWGRERWKIGRGKEDRLG